MIDLSIVIVSYNTKDFLKSCIESVYKTAKNLKIEIIVSDNNSHDGSSEMISKEFKDVILIENKENLGFSKANNVGIKKTTGRYILFLNSDTVVYEKTLEYMVNFMDKNKDAGAATCKLVMPNGKIDDASHRGFPTPWNSITHFSGLSKIFGKTKIFGGYNLGYMDLSNTHVIDALAGAFMIVRRKAGEEVGWWDEDYFFYGEDLDFCFMLKQKGWKVYYVPQVSILHYKGVSGGIKKDSQKITTASKETKKFATKWRFAAMRIFYKKHYEQKYPWIVTRLVYIGIFFKRTLSSL
ncbi:MAG TPA: glycosyltransferase family 2 protein [Candidatus Sulfotelmatobacter sp.]|nr:glycosyltransferase family 2 protein [Candidatus Sulfotelmatobacter sp.]